MSKQETLRRFSAFEDAIMLKALEVYMLALTDAARTTTTLDLDRGALIGTLNGIERLTLKLKNDAPALKKPVRAVQVNFKPGDFEVKE